MPGWGLTVLLAATHRRGAGQGDERHRQLRRRARPRSCGVSSTTSCRTTSCCRSRSSWPPTSSRTTRWACARCCRRTTRVRRHRRRGVDARGPREPRVGGSRFRPGLDRGPPPEDRRPRPRPTGLTACARCRVLDAARLKTAFSRSTMTVSERAAARSVASPAEAGRRRGARAGRSRARGAAPRTDAAGLTVAEVLAEAGLSTRAFYRHFQSKDELVLAVFEQEAQRRYAGLEAQLATAALAARRARDVGRRDARARVRAAAVPAHEGARRRRRARPGRLPRGVRGDPRGRGRAARSGAAGACRARIRRATHGRSTRSRGSSSSRSCAATPIDRDDARAHVLAVLPAGPGPATVKRAAVNLPPVDSEYYDTEYETMPRPQLARAPGGVAPARCSRTRTSTRR